MASEKSSEVQLLPCEVQTETACVICGGWARTRRSKFCLECLTGSCPSSVSSAVATAIRRGDLKPIRECVCVDCGAPARHYDHRDYNKPVDVEPVCKSCNARRPPAIRYGRTATGAWLNGEG